MHLTAVKSPGVPAQTGQPGSDVRITAICLWSRGPKT